MHLDTDSIQRLLHGELTSSAAAAARRHLDRCDPCRQELTRARTEEEGILQILHHLDHPVPQLDVRSVRFRLDAGRSARRSIAAGIALALVTSGLLYAAPGSPLPGLLRRAASVLLSHTPPAAVPGGKIERGPGPVAGLMVVAPDSFDILFDSAQAVGTVTIIIEQTDRLSVRAFGAPVPFDSEVDRVIIRNRGTASSYEIRIPFGAPVVRLEVSGALLWLKRGSRIHSVVSPETVGYYVLPLRTAQR